MLLALDELVKDLEQIESGELGFWSDLARYRYLAKMLESIKTIRASNSLPMRQVDLDDIQKRILLLLEP